MGHSHSWRVLYSNPVCSHLLSNPLQHVFLILFTGPFDVFWYLLMSLIHRFEESIESSGIFRSLRKFVREILTVLSISGKNLSDQAAYFRYLTVWWLTVSNIAYIMFISKRYVVTSPSILVRVGQVQAPITYLWNIPGDSWVFSLLSKDVLRIKMCLL